MAYASITLEKNQDISYPKILIPIILTYVSERIFDFVIDFSQVKYIDQKNIEFFDYLYKAIQSCGGGIILYGLSEEVQAAFKKAGILESLTIIQDLDDAKIIFEQMRKN